MATEEVRGLRVWICTNGSYSDYHIKALYSDESIAKRLSEAYGWNEPKEFEVDAIEPPSEAKQGLNYYSVHLHPDEGDQSWSQVLEPSNGKGIGWYPAYSWVTSGKSNDVMRFNTLCWAKDKEHAVKIAAERMYQTPRPEKT